MLRVSDLVHFLEDGAKVKDSDINTVSDWVPKKNSANFESDTFLRFAYVVNMSKIATFLGRF